MNGAERTALLVRLTARAGEREALLAGVRALFDAHAREPAFVSAAAHRSAEEADVVIVQETWAESRAAFETRLATAEAFRVHGSRIEPLVAKREVTWLETAAVWPAPGASSASAR